MHAARFGRGAPAPLLLLSAVLLLVVVSRLEEILLGRRGRLPPAGWPGPYDAQCPPWFAAGHGQGRQHAQAGAHRDPHALCRPQAQGDDAALPGLGQGVRRGGEAGSGRGAGAGHRLHRGARGQQLRAGSGRTPPLGVSMSRPPATDDIRKSASGVGQHPDQTNTLSDYTSDSAVCSGNAQTPTLRPAGPPSLHRPARKAPWTAMSSAHCAKLAEVGNTREVQPAEAKGYVHMFGVFEPNKGPPRSRPIKGPRDINEMYGRETLSDTDMATKAQIIEMVSKPEHKHCAAFDFKSYFDQFELHPDIGALMCFKKGKKFYALNTAPMGQRHIPQLAQSTTRKLADFEGRRCESASIIDDTITMGSTTEDVVHDGQCFAARGDAVGVTFNEDTSDIEKLVKTRGELGGVGFGLNLRCVFLTEKIVRKLKESWANHSEWTYRNYAAHMGLLFWPVGLVDVPLADYFTALRHYAQVCRAFSTMPTVEEANAFWDKPAFVTKGAMQNLEAWTAEVAMNRPVQLDTIDGEADCDWLVYVDSCRFGFGYLAVNPKNGQVRYHGQQRPWWFRAQNSSKLHRSVFTEPRGVYMTLCHLITFTGKHQRVRVWTDSVTTMRAGNRGHNTRSEDLNAIVQKINASFPATDFTIEYEFVRGVDNDIADALSRGREITPEAAEGAAAEILRQHHRDEEPLMEGVPARAYAV